MANTIDETKAEIQIGQGWEGIACPIIVKGTTHSYRNIIRKIATSEDVAVEVGKFGIVKIKKKKKYNGSDRTVQNDGITTSLFYLVYNKLDKIKLSKLKTDVTNTHIHRTTVQKEHERRYTVIKVSVSLYKEH